MSIECYEGDCPYHEKEEPFCMLNDCQKCPHCSKLGFVPAKAYTHAEQYGSGINIVKCIHCSNTVRIYLRRRVVFDLTCAQMSVEAPTIAD